jgi:ABC-type sugar transport system substrate-binding protein
MGRARTRWGFVLFVLLALVAAGCGRGDGGGGGGGTETVRVGAVTGNFSNPAVKQMVDAMQAEAKKDPNIQLSVQESANVEEQISKAQTMIAQGIKIIGIHPWEGKAILAFEKQYSGQGVKFFNLIDDVPGAVDSGYAVSFISGDEHKGGELLGQWLTTKLDAGKVAIITGTPGNFAADYRTDGFKKGIASKPGLKVVAESSADWQRDQALRVATDMLTANPDLAAIFANNDEMAFGALQALKAAGKVGKVIVIGYNGTCIGIEATLKSDFAADGILPIPQFGQEFVTNAVKVAKNESVPKTIAPPILALSSQETKAIADGSKTDVDASLKQRVDQAAGGKC